jgi:hypothetical protein
VKVGVTSGITATLAGQIGNPGSANGSGSQAQFNTPEGVALTNGGLTALVADTGNNLVRRVDGLPLCYRVVLPFVLR